MGFQILADIVLVVHCAIFTFIVFGEILILLGGVLGWKWIRVPFFRVSHLAMILIVAIESILRVKCPLTALENFLLAAAGEDSERCSFAVRLLYGLFGIDVSDDYPIWTLVYAAIGGLIGLTYVFIPPNWKDHSDVGIRHKDLRIALKAIGLALGIGIGWYVVRWVRVEACEACLGVPELSHKFAASSRIVESNHLVRQGITVRRKLAELGAFCRNGEVFDWRGRKIVFFAIREFGQRPHGEDLERQRLDHLRLEKLEAECTVIRMYNIRLPY